MATLRASLVQLAAWVLLISSLGSATAWANSKLPDKLDIQAALLRRDYPSLERQLTTLQERAEADVCEELAVEIAFGAFRSSRLELEAPLREWVKTSPKSYAAQMALAEYLSRTGWLARGGKYAAETSSDQFALMNRLFAQAVQAASAAVSLHPMLTEGYSLLINVAMARGEHERIAEIMRQGLQHVPASYCIRRTAMQTLLPRWGGSYAAMQQFAEDSRKYAKENPRLLNLAGLPAWDMGTRAVADKNYGGAVQLFTKALEAGPNDEVYASRADVYLRMDEKEKALADANQSLLLHPQVPSVLADRSEALAKTGNTEVAVADVETAAQLDPGDERVQHARERVSWELVRVGCDLAKQGRYDDALADFDAALKLNPKNHNGLYQRGRVYISKGQMQQAREDLEKAISIDPHFFDAYQTLDWLLVKNGQLDDVISRWNQFIALEPTNANAYLERAGTFRHKGDMPSALRDLKSACDLGNGNACQILASTARR